MAYSTIAQVPYNGPGSAVSPSFYGLFKGSFLTSIIAALNTVITLENQQQGVGNNQVSITAVAAAGATQGTATLLPAGGFYNVSTTTSSEGVKLPAAATGLVVELLAPTAHGFKVYANASGQSIGTGTTNTTAVTIAANTGVRLFAISTTKWRLAG